MIPVLEGESLSFTCAAEGGSPPGHAIAEFGNQEDDDFEILEGNGEREISVGKNAFDSNHKMCI